MQNRIHQSHFNFEDQNTKDSNNLEQFTVLNPTTVTRDIINRIYFWSHNFLITGERGCGKTFAYLIYKYLSSFILKYRVN